VLQYAVEVLRVEHVIVCGHYGCGGVEAAWKRSPLGLIDNWLRHVQDIAERHQSLFTRSMTDAQCTDRLGELNVLEQVANVCRTTIVQDAWRRGQPLSIHGWIYRLQNGLLRDLGLTVSRDEDLNSAYARALGGLASA
jgi:carbonic anhydrase